MSKASQAAVVQGLGPIVIMEKLGDLHLASEAPKALGLQVRKGDDSLGMDELEASIRAYGVITPLLVKRLDGKLYVTGGNRRLKALRRINGDGAGIVPTINSDDFSGDDRELAMATNVSLPPHPVDRYEVISALVSEGTSGMSPADIQERFALSSRQFAQVMRLGSLSPRIRDLWRDGAIDAKTAQAFTLAPSVDAQNKAYDKILKDSWSKRVSDHEVKMAFVGSQREAGRFVTFVGVEECRAAGILKQEDLFSNSHTVTSEKKLQEMVDAKMQAIADHLTGPCKWAWAMPEGKIVGNTWSYITLQPDPKLAKPTAAEKKTIAELEEIMRAAINEDRQAEAENAIAAMQEEIRQRGYTDAQRAKAGCFLKINHEGSLVIEYGKVKPEEARKVAASERPKSTADKKPGDAAISNALAARLSGALQTAAAAVIKRDPSLAIAAVLAGASSSGHVIDIKVGGSGYVENPAKEFVSVFGGAVNETSASQMSMLAQVAAAAVSIVTHNAASMPLDNAAVAALFGMMKAAEINKAITENFDAKDYFSSVSGDTIVEAVRAAMGDEHAAQVAKMDKAGKAKFATENVPKTGWLPKVMRTVHYAGPVEGKPTKEKPPAKKAAKKAAKKPVAKKKAKK